jgi:alpha-N-acetylglucosamine transferase
MKFMNSYIVSFLHELELHYYDKEQGYSVIDKAVQAALDNEGTVSVKEISNIVEEIEASYVEEDVEDVEDADMTSESWDD